ncbi:FAD-binding protein [Mycobacterium gordonae]|uniref:FAD-binding protein n=1 Tax=Mycobacterium gordonae TaxID=1778 RepID=UPI00210CA574|nr:FAD-binding protein [Mycobacterium gordonae]MCQ4362865.1 FAD-binding protein [Mycobacterium gordonae]
MPAARKSGGRRLRLNEPNLLLGIGLQPHGSHSTLLRRAARSAVPLTRRSIPPRRRSGLALPGVSPHSTTIPAGLPVSDTCVDLLVVGSGTGMAAALAARELGLSVLLMEKWSYIGGSTARSGGALWLTMTRFNQNAAAGIDPDFGRGASAYDRYYGDPTVKPNPNLRTLVNGPFYAVKMVLSDLGTCGGLRADEWARVLREDGSVIAGLYAVGNAAANAYGTTYSGAGATIAQGLVYGFIAARDAAC